jgi:MraZ protein
MTATPETRHTYAGTFTHSVDAKGRVTIPASWRLPNSEPGHYLALPISGDSPHILVLPPWKIRDLQMELTEGDRKGDRELARKMASVFSKGESLKIDDNGRFVLSSKLLKNAGISKKASFVGCLLDFQIWDPKAYVQFDGSDALSESDVEDFRY